MITPGQAPVAVTGASGFVGTHIVRELLARGHHVRACVRDPKNPKKTAHLVALAEGLPGELSLAQGDLMKPGSYDEAFKGAGGVIHVAAIVQLAAKDGQRDIVDPSVVGTRNVLDSVKKSGSVQRVVHTSSVAAIYGRPIQGKIYTEADWCDDATVKNNPYAVAKREAERLAARFPEEVNGEISVVHINPSLVLGPVYTEAHVWASPSIIRDLLVGTFPANPQLHFSMVDAREVARAHAEAMERPNVSGRYILAAETGWVQDAAKTLAERFPSYRIKTGKLPNLLLYAAAMVDKRISFSMVRELAGRTVEFDNARSRSELGIEYRSVADSLTDTVNAMVEGGWVTPRTR
ncbi:MAG: NAD-dependent epimerase/dehydratase family protein [Bradymonadia bacterium]